VLECRTLPADRRGRARPDQRRPAARPRRLGHPIHGSKGSNRCGSAESASYQWVRTTGTTTVRLTGGYDASSRVQGHGRDCVAAGRRSRRDSRCRRPRVVHRRRPIDLHPPTRRRRCELGTSGCADRVGGFLLLLALARSDALATAVRRPHDMAVYGLGMTAGNPGVVVTSNPARRRADLRCSARLALARILWRARRPHTPLDYHPHWPSGTAPHRAVASCWPTCSPPGRGNGRRCRSPNPAKE